MSATDAAIDKIREAIKSVDVRSAVSEPLWVDPEVIADMGDKLASLEMQAAALTLLTADTRSAALAVQEFRIAMKRDHHSRLFGHPRARVFIVGNRLVVVHSQGGAA